MVCSHLHFRAFKASAPVLTSQATLAVPSIACSCSCLTPRAGSSDRGLEKASMRLAHALLAAPVLLPAGAAAYYYQTNVGPAVRDIGEEMPHKLAPSWSQASDVLVWHHATHMQVCQPRQYWGPTRRSTLYCMAPAS